MTAAAFKWYLTRMDHNTSHAGVVFRINKSQLLCDLMRSSVVKGRL